MPGGQIQISHAQISADQLDYNQTELTYNSVIVKTYNNYTQDKNTKDKMMQRLWRSKTTLQQKIVPKAELLLPNAIGCRIIELEMQIDDGNLNKKIVIELLQEYTKAVEFYEEKSDDRYKLYQKKIQNFLQKPAVDALLKGTQNKSTFLIKKQKTQQQIRKATHVNTTEVKKIMQNSNQEVQKQKQKIEKQLNFQYQNLQKRIEKKKKAKGMSSSFSVSSSSQDEGYFTSFKQIKNPKNKVYM